MEFLQPLNEQQEKEMIMKAKGGCKESEDKLVEHNMRLVAYVSRKYNIPDMDPEDVISIGTIGLIKAVKSFDISKNNKFATYATRCIQNEIFMNLRKTKNKTQDKYLDEVITFDTNGNELSLIDTLGTHKEEVEGDLETKEDIEIVHMLMEKLNAKEKMIIRYRFGIGTEEKKQEEIAKEFQISQSYVSRIEKNAIKKLRTYYEQKVG